MSFTYQDYLDLANSFPLDTPELLNKLFPIAKPSCVKNSVEVSTDEGEPIIEPIGIAQICEAITILCDGWPRRIGSILFVQDVPGRIDWLEKPANLFAFVGAKSLLPPIFRSNAGLHNKAEVFAELQRIATSYKSIETTPHEPKMEGHFYACDQPEPGNGDALSELIARYAPETDMDADLIKAMFATCIWGGESGTRPAFLITSDSGRGVGKTTLASHVARLAGGGIELSANEDAGVIKQRLLSPEGMTKRVALLDNVKTLKFSWAELESLITAPVISGKRMYTGEGQRPNNIVWIITLNGASLAKDLSQRCVIIKLSKPKRSGTWAEDTRKFIDDHRQEVIADCIALLRSERFPLVQYGRWASWERDVLERLPEPSDAQAIIRERQAVADVEDEEAGLVQDHFAQRLRALRYDTDRDRVHIPSGVAADWYAAATRERVTTTAVTRRLNQSINEGTVTLIQRNKCNAYGRGFVWWGPLGTSETTIQTDITTRLKSHSATGDDGGTFP